MRNINLKSSIALLTLPFVVSGALTGCASQPSKNIEPSKNLPQKESPQNVTLSEEDYKKQVVDLTVEFLASRDKKATDEQLRKITDTTIRMFEITSVENTPEYAEGVMRINWLGNFDGDTNTKMSDFWVELPKDPEFKQTMVKYYEVSNELLEKQESTKFRPLVDELKQKNPDYKNHELNMAAMLLLGSTWGLENRDPDVRAAVTELANYVTGMENHFKKNFSQNNIRSNSRT